ncbi:MAG: diaminopimelate epimerase [Methanomicrobiales archaeon]|nr:diaminopimelate epimerase [Methanomicrobiales archaeon]MDD1654214.1 diaminopimelate epimerase [Methanomicrobiales archaeon]
MADDAGEPGERCCIYFTKLQGNGNDFVLIDEMEGTVVPDETRRQFAALFCDRRFGIGADGILFLSKSEKADLQMRLFQPDGSEAEMCGNGIRCLAKYARDRDYVKDLCSVETLSGVIRVKMREDAEGEFLATVEMPAPKFARSDIPATGEGEYKEEIAGDTVYAVNTGVPHAVIFVDEIGSVDIREVGPIVRNHASFVNGANVNFVEKAGDNTLRIRTYERGVEEETLSCGTGAMASAAVARKLGMVGDTVQVETWGGPLSVRLGEVNEIEGPARTVFTGSIPL